MSTQEAKQAIYDAVHHAVRSLSRADYRDVLEEIIDHFKEDLEALDAEERAEAKKKGDD